MIARPVCVAAGVTLLFLTGCRTPPPSGTEAAAPSAVSAPQSSTSGVLYSIDATASQVLVFVYREGAMSALGHNHVISIRELRGSVQLTEPLERSRFELRFPVASMTVDEPALRAAAGEDFSSVVSDSARDGTRANMLGEKLLQAMGFPEIALSSVRVESAADGQVIALTRVSLRGAEYLVQVPMRLLRAADQLSATGEITLRQSELGLTPYSVLMGALRVRDAMQLRFRLVARRVTL